MAEPERRKPDSHIPPPMDPYARYQTPYPRHPSDPDNQNPFILFRRFADEQFQNFFSGMPRPFSSTSLPQSSREMTRTEQSSDFERELARRMAEQTLHFERDMTEMVKQLEQEREGRRAEVQGLVDQQEMLKRGLEKCPELNGQNAKPATRLDTELDTYEAALGVADAIASQEMACPWKDEVPTKTSFWGNGLGWDGRRRARNIALMPVAESSRSGSDDSLAIERVPDSKTLDLLHELSRARENDFTEDLTSLDPFSSDDNLDSWMQKSAYSPLNLGNLSNTRNRLFSRMSHYIFTGRDVPKELVDAAEAPDTDLQQRLEEHLPWADAFEDLVSLRRTGKMVEEIRSTLKPQPLDWEMQMEQRGSFGSDSKWKRFKEEGLWVSDFDRKSKHIQDEMVGYQKGDLAAHHNEDASTEVWRTFPEWITALDKALGIDSFKRFAENEQAQIDSKSAVMGARGMAWPPPDSVIGMIDQAKSQELLSNTDSNTDFRSISYSDSRAWQYEGESSPNAVISTSTTTKTRTRPDGSTETKRIQMKKFANGHEETEESVEATPTALSRKDERRIQQFASSTKNATKGGWFWN